MATVVKRKFTETLSAPESLEDARGAQPSIIFVVTQSEILSNGGVESISLVLEGVRKFRPIVVTQLETAANQRWQNAGLRVVLWPMPARNAWSMLKANLRMLRLVRSSGAKVVHCNDIFGLFQTGFGARLAGALIVFNVRNIKSADHQYGWRWQIARRLSARQLVLSRDMRDQLASRLGMPQVNSEAQQAIKFIYSAVSPKRMSPASDGDRLRLRRELGIDANCFAIGYVAAFQTRKGQYDFIVKAGARLRRDVPAARVYFVGDFDPAGNGYAKSCVDAAREAGLEDLFRFVGYRGEIADWYRAFDLVLVASKNEGLARCMIESLACGTPVVSFDVCSAREILEERKCGVVVRREDYGALIDQVATLFAQPEIRKELSRNAAALAKELFAPAEIVSQYEDLYLSLIGN
jgi:glycosyltransferase involved in cell wall biosynthesis